MATPKVIRIKRSAVQGKIPTAVQLVLGELALNTYDGRLFTIKNDGSTSTVVQIGADRFTGDVTGSGNGSVALTLANTTVIPASYGSATEVATLTVDSKGRLTAASSVAISFPVTSVAGKTGNVTLTLSDVNGAAPLDAPHFTGIPEADTAPPGTDSRQLATTAFVMASISASTAGVSAFNGRTGAIVLSSTDVTNALGFSPINADKLGAANGVATLSASGKLTDAQIPESLQGAMTYQGVWNASTNSPTLTSGVGTKGWYFKVSVDGSTTLDGNSTWKIGDSVIFNGTAWERLEGSQSDVTSVAGRVGAVTLSIADVSGAAPLTSPSFTGIPLSTTAAVNTNTKQIATTEFVLAQAASTSPWMDGTASPGTSTLFSRADHIHPVDTSRAPLSSPDFTGVPQAATAAPGTNTRQLATTSFVANAVSSMNIGVATFNTRAGAVTLTSSDVTTALGFTPYNSTNPAGYAKIASPTFTGVVTIPAGSHVPGSLVDATSGISAAGTTQATATALTADFNTVTFASVNQGVVLPATIAGKTVIVFNISISAINVYPPAGSMIDNLAQDTPLQLLSGAVAEFYAISGTIWSSSTRTQVNGSYILGSVNDAINADSASYSLDSGKLGGALPSAYALLASPDFSGTPLAPTAAIGTSTRQLATTAFVLNQASNVTPNAPGTAAAGVSTTFARGDHVHPVDSSKAPLASPTFSGTVTTPNIVISSGVGNGLGFWGTNDSYRISMGNAAEYQYGPVTDYSIKLFMGGAAGRGIVFGSNGVTPVAAINTVNGDAKFAGTVTANAFSGPLTGSVSGNVTGSLTGNASTATTLQTARTINGVSFNGSANITVKASTTNILTIGSYLTGGSFDGSAAVTVAVDAASLNTASKIVARDASGNFSAGTITATSFVGPLSGNASTAAVLQTARAINGVSFDGSADITVKASTTNSLTAGSYLTGGSFNGSTAITFAVDAASTNLASKIVARDASGNFAANVITASTFTGPLSGNASTATALQTTVTINGVSFNGSSNITVKASTTNALVVGSYLTGGSFDGSTSVTVAVDASSSNVASKVVARDASGNFSAGTITANLIGTVTGSSTKVDSADTRSTADTPTSRDRGIYFDFKTNTTDSLSDGGTYHGVMTWRPFGLGADLSGGQVAQIASTDNGNLWHRVSTSTTAFGSWRKLWDSNNLTNLNQLTNGPGYITGISSSNVISALGYTPLNKAGDTMTGALNLPPVSVLSSVTASNFANLDFGITQTGSGGFVPFMHGRTQVTTGYVQHITLGGYRSGGSNWNGGLFVGLGGNDANPTEYYLMGFGGTITHSVSGTFLSSSNYNSYAPTLTGSGASGTWNINVSGTASNSNALNGVALGTSTPTWGSIPPIQANGVLEIGRYIDFHGVSGGTEDYTVRLDGGTTGSTTLTCTGNFTATGEVTAYSDMRIKTNIETISSALDKVSRMRGVYFDRVDVESPRQVGVIAQEVEQVIPEAVRSDDEGRLSVAYGNLAGLFIEAIKELKKDNEELRMRIAQLEAK